MYQLNYFQKNPVMTKKVASTDFPLKFSQYLTLNQLSLKQIASCLCHIIVEI